MDDMRQIHDDWLKDQIQKKDPNPLIAVYGKGPEGKQCKTCHRLYLKQFSNRYWKCRLRKETNGAGSDHRVGWSACAKYTEQS